MASYIQQEREHAMEQVREKINQCWEQISQRCGSKRSCASLLTAPETAPTPSYTASISFSVGYRRPWIPYVPDSKVLEVALESLECFLQRHQLGPCSPAML